MQATVEIFVLIDADGEYAVGRDADEAREKYEADIRDLSDADGFRLFRTTLNVPLPQIVDLAATMAETKDAATLAVA